MQHPNGMLHFPLLRQFASSSALAYHVMEGDIMNACELTASITAIANWLACQLTTEQLELLGVSLTQLGDTILTIVTQKSICCK